MDMDLMDTDNINYRHVAVVIKGPSGFGFALGESEMGPIVKQIMDRPRCAQLQEGDVLVEVNGERVGGYNNSDLVKVLKRYPEKNQATFLVNRQPPETQPTEQDLEADLHGEVIYVSLQKTVSGFGFTIIGGDRPGELLQIKSIVRGSVADRDGRLLVGDVLVRINGISVLTYNHRKVVDLVQSLPLNSDVSVEVRRGYPLQEFRGDELPSYHESSHGYNDYPPPQDNYNQHNQQQQHQQLERVAVHIVKGPLGFGFALGESEMGPIVKEIVDHPRCAELQEGDILTEVNRERVRGYDHSDLVTVLKRCPKGNQATFVVFRQPPKGELMGNGGPFTTMEVCLLRQVSGFGFRIIGGEEEGCQATVEGIVAGGAADLDGRLQIGDEISHINGNSVINASHREVIGLMGDAAALGDVVLGIRRRMPMSESVPYPSSQDSLNCQVEGISTDLASDDEEIHHIDIRRSGRGFGFSIRGGAEYNSPLCVLRIADGGAAQVDRRLRVGDELLEINGNNTENMLHSDTITIIKHGGDVVKLIIRRVPDEPFIGGKSDGTVFSPTAMEAKDLYAQNFLGRRGHDAEQGKHPEERERLYNEALKVGYVSVNTSNVLLFGMAGTGKTSTKNLIFGLPPPEKRNSTPLANAAERLLVRKIRNLSGTKVQATQDSWKPVTADELKQHIADLVQSYGKSILSAPEASAEIATKVQHMSLKPETSTTDPIEIHSEINPPLHDDKAASTGSIIHMPSHVKSIPDQLPSHTTVSEGKEYDDKFLRYVADLVSEIQSLVTMTTAREVFGSNWLYFIDSGGQPHFYNLLPLFIQDVSVALYVFRLSDRLDDRPLVEYYKDDVPVGDAFRSNLTTADNFKYLVQSIQSHNKDCRLVCIGTHSDKAHKCREKLEDKNRCLFELLPESIVEKCHFNNVCGTEQLILCIDTQVLGSDRKKTADAVREIIRECPCKEIKVPIWWYNLEIIIEKISVEKDQKILSFDQCQVVALTLHFEKDALIEALKFFHKHHIFHFYPDVLPNVLFCDTQVLLDKVTELVEYASYLRDSSKTASGHGKKIQIRDRGIITLDFLSTFPKHYVDGLFGPAQLIEVFKHLFIATLFAGLTEYFMPSLLGILSDDELTILRKALEKKSTPIFIQFKNGWPRCGVFCCLQVYLIKECHWSLGKISSKNKPKQNIAKMYLPNSPQLVTIIDSITYIEIYVESKEISICSEIRRNILSGIQVACKTLHYDNEEPELAFLCPDSIQKKHTRVFNKAKYNRHPAVLLAGSGWMRCTQHEDNTHPLEEKHSVWIVDLNQGASQSPEIDYSQTDCSNAYTTMVKCSVSLNYAMSKEPLSLAAALFRCGLISQSTLNETAELNETKRNKGSRLYRAVLDDIHNFPSRFSDFVQALRGDRILYSDVLEELDGVFEQYIQV
ncbi:uncharacterized protein LOC135346702 isoform X2 [Halichondria panicea]|uniref:uncharacterized protein LOC135346702 isoform X2 n=1 Tax=Halichondria panicea TaxID=6063 RepID=UPI00312B42BB